MDLFYPDGSRYIGDASLYDLELGYLPHGTGTYWCPRYIYSGAYSMGRWHGKGTVWYFGTDWSVTVYGEWENGKLITWGWANGILVQWGYLFFFVS